MWKYELESYALGEENLEHENLSILWTVCLLCTGDQRNNVCLINSVIRIILTEKKVSLL